MGLKSPGEQNEEDWARDRNSAKKRSKITQSVDGEDRGLVGEASPLLSRWPGEAHSAEQMLNLQWCVHPPR